MYVRYHVCVHNIINSKTWKHTFLTLCRQAEELGFLPHKLRRGAVKRKGATLRQLSVILALLYVRRKGLWVAAAEQANDPHAYV